MGSAPPNRSAKVNERETRGSAAPMTFTASLQRLWHDVQSGPPGRRFQDWYERSHTAKNRGGWIGRGLKIFAGILAIAVGLIEIVFPGPAIVFIAIGGALLATESRVIAKAMDWSEVKLRTGWRWLRRRWHRTSWPVRIAVCGTAALGIAIVGYVAYRLFVA